MRIRKRFCAFRKSAMTLNYDFNFKGEKMTELKLANIKELRDRYDFVDIFAYFKSGELVAWCDKNGHSDEAKAVESLAKDSPKSSHLKLYEIFNGANNTPQWLREYFKIYERWINKQDKLSALVDKVLSLYESLEKNNYIESEADKKERKSLDNKICKMTIIINALDSKCEAILCGLQYCDDIKEQWQNLRFCLSLAVLSAQKWVSNYKKLSKITTMSMQKSLKWLNTLSAEELNMPVFALPKNARVRLGD